MSQKIYHIFYELRRIEFLQWITAVLIVCYCININAEPQREGTALLGGTIATVVTTLENAGSAASENMVALQRLQAQLELLEALLNKGTVSTDADLREVIIGYADLIPRTADALKNVNASHDIDAMTHDVAIKNGYLSKRAGISGERASLGVRVRVNLFQRGTSRELTGYQVIASPVAFARKARWLFRFSGPTNDAVRNLPPGRYLFRVSQDQKLFEDEYDVGAKGELSETKTLYFDEPKP